MADLVEFDAFVATRTQGLLRTAYLLVQDEGLAEDLLQTSLTKAWFAWSRIEGEPEAYVRRILVTTSASWWRRRWTRETPTAELPERVSPDSSHDWQDLWDAIGNLPGRQRAVVVLRYL